MMLLEEEEEGTRHGATERLAGDGRPAEGPGAVCLEPSAPWRRWSPGGAGLLEALAPWARPHWAARGHYTLTRFLS